MRWPRRKKGKRPGPARKDVAEECRAFLSGRLWQAEAGRGGPVPPWAWANRVAHAGKDERRELAAAGVEPARGTGGFCRLGRAALEPPAGRV